MYLQLKITRMVYWKREECYKTSTGKRTNFLRIQRRTPYTHKGDTRGHIGQCCCRLNTTVSHQQKLNGIANPNKICAGQFLKVTAISDNTVTAKKQFT